MVTVSLSTTPTTVLTARTAYGGGAILIRALIEHDVGGVVMQDGDVVWWTDPSVPKDRSFLVGLAATLDRLDKGELT